MFSGCLKPPLNNKNLHYMDFILVVNRNKKKRGSRMEGGEKIKIWESRDTAKMRGGNCDEGWWRKDSSITIFFDNSIINIEIKWYEKYMVIVDDIKIYGLSWCEI